MISHEEARTRVARGAAYLDRTRPGWFQRIDLGPSRHPVSDIPTARPAVLEAVR